MKKSIVSCLLIVMLIFPVSASTHEAQAKPNFWQEFDITFWQTAPFAILWGSFLGQSAGPKVVVSFATVVSFANALVYARQTTNHLKKSS